MRRLTLALAVGVALFGGCQPIDEPLSASSEAAFAAQTGVLKDPGTNERWTEAEILAGESGLTHLVGDQTIDESSGPRDEQGYLVWGGYWVDGCIAVRTDKVVIQNVYVRSDHACVGGDPGNPAAGGQAIIATGFDGSGVTEVAIVDSEINGLTTLADVAGIGQAEWSAMNVNIHGVVKGVRVDHNNRLLHSYIHDLSSSSVHGEGVFWGGGSGNIEIHNNWIRANASTGAIAFLNDYDGGYAVVTHNYLDGNGGVGFRGGAYINKPGDFFHHLTFSDNVIQSNGSSSPDEVNAWCGSCDGNVWSNNTDQNGNAIPAPVPIVG